MADGGESLERARQDYLAGVVGIPMSHQAIVDAITARLGVLRQRLCPNDGENVGWSKEDIHIEFGYRPFQDTPHAACGGTGVITDPRYQAAWEMLVRLPVQYAGQGRPSGSAPEQPMYTGRHVDDWPDGAVLGLLEGVVETLWNADTAPSLTVNGRWVTAIKFRWLGDVPLLGETLIAKLEVLNEQR